MKEQLSPATYRDMALLVGSDLDLGNATAEELDDLEREAFAFGFVHVQQ
jgi:hypothetical protein